jgi:hypothetical protein
MGAVSTGSGLAPDIVFGRRAASTYYVESMRIDASGNLLVGSTDADAGISGTPTNPPRFSFKVGNGEGLDLPRRVRIIGIHSMIAQSIIFDAMVLM